MANTRAISFFVFTIALLAFSSWSFYQNVHPWKLVKTLSNGHGDDAGSSGNYHLGFTPRTLALSPDESQLLVAKPDGTCDVLNLNTLEVTDTVGEPQTEYNESLRNPGMGGSYNVQWLNSGNILITNNKKLDLYDSQFNPIAQLENPLHFAHVEVSPDEKQIAETKHSPRVWCPENNLTTDLTPNGFGLNGGNQGLDWFKDSRHLLFSDKCKVCLYDTLTKEVKLTLFPIDPKGDVNQAQLEKPANEKYTASYGLSYFTAVRLFDDEQKLLALHSADGAFGESHSHYIRTHCIKDGSLLKQAILPSAPRYLTLSDDRKHAYVMMVPNFNNLIHIYDLDSLELVNVFDFKGGNHYPNRIKLLDDTTALIFNKKTYLLDLTEKNPPINLLSENSSCLDAILVNDGQTLITSGQYKTINIWQKQHEGKSAYAMWQFWICHISLVGIFTYITFLLLKKRGNKATAMIKVTFPLMALLLAIYTTNLLLTPAFDQVWNLNEMKPASYWVTSSLVIILTASAIWGTLRGKDACRVLGAFLSLIAAIVLLYLSIKFIHALTLLTQNDTDLLANIPELSSQATIAALATLLALTAFYGFLFYLFISKKHTRQLCQSESF